MATFRPWRGRRSPARRARGSGDTISGARYCWARCTLGGAGAGGEFAVARQSPAGTKLFRTACPAPRHPDRGVAEFDDDLKGRRVDIVVRLRRFENQDLIVRKIGQVSFALYGCGSYLARHGDPDVTDGCVGHHLISCLGDHEVSAQSVWMAKNAARAQVTLKADSYETQHWAAYCGGGLALLPRFLADVEPPFGEFQRLCRRRRLKFGWASTVRTARFHACARYWTSSLKQSETVRRSSDLPE